LDIGWTPYITMIGDVRGEDWSNLYTSSIIAIQLTSRESILFTTPCKCQVK
jgi:hypothetical protein